jgi:hypothetical protein
MQRRRKKFLQILDLEDLDTILLPHLANCRCTAGSQGRNISFKAGIKKKKKTNGSLYSTHVVLLNSTGGSAW